jgi:7-cyano-7-deazaguanine reductase
VTNRMLDELRARLEPRFLRIRAEFNVRGGIYTSVVAEHRRPGWSSPARVELP